MRAWLSATLDDSAPPAAIGRWLAPMVDRTHAVAGEATPPGRRERPAFASRYTSHTDAVARLCRRLLGSETAADDAAQEIFLRAQRGYTGYDPRQPFRPWLLGITRNHCIDVLRRRSRERRIFSAADLDPSDLRGSDPSPLAASLNAERRTGLLGAIEALPDRYRVPLVLRYFEELDYKTIAETLDVTHENVGVLLYRARRRLRDALEEDPS
ncbi:MAG: sigma-70 family RNA polymerase sigma factor [Deltaproteobacteria bacterium]|nr:sigma-70 family RNA polymerase sigma factor [Deltaproteobacteria bacterium]MBW2363001.1 sigma-70 family RNA polymerase sigma factor [Deltaproteobacteria bacterium]